MENNIISGGRNLITGDTHGQISRIYMIVKFLQENDVLWIAGDFGYLFRNDKDENVFLDDVQVFLENKNAYIVFCDGNHENHAELNKLPVEQWCGGRVHKLRERIIHVLRGEILNVHGKSFFCFGGAYSIDRAMRKIDVSYWEEELPTDEDFSNGNRNLEKVGFEVDYIITHTCPLGTVGYMQGSHGIVEELPLQNYLEWVREKVSYRQWYFGHWHEDKQLWQGQRAIYFDIVDMENNEVL